MRTLARILTSGWFHALVLLAALPSTLDGVMGWHSWITAIPTPIALAIVIVCALLVVRSLYLNRTKMVSWCKRLGSAAKDGFATFRQSMWPAPELTATEPPDGDAWEIVKDSVRQVEMVKGEGYPALVGIAKAKERSGNRYVYMYAFIVADGAYTEWRTDPPHGTPRVSRRHAVVKVDGEELSDMTFNPYTTPVVFSFQNTDQIRQGVLHLLEVGDLISITFTDYIADASGKLQSISHPVLRVPVRGYKAAYDRLLGQASFLHLLS